MSGKRRMVVAPLTIANGSGGRVPHGSVGWNPSLNLQRTFDNFGWCVTFVMVDKDPDGPPPKPGKTRGYGQFVISEDQGGLTVIRRWASDRTSYRVGFVRQMRVQGARDMRAKPWIRGYPHRMDVQGLWVSYLHTLGEAGGKSSLELTAGLNVLAPGSYDAELENTPEGQLQLLDLAARSTATLEAAQEGGWKVSVVRVILDSVWTSGVFFLEGHPTVVCDLVAEGVAENEQDEPTFGREWLTPAEIVAAIENGAISDARMVQALTVALVVRDGYCGTFTP